MNLRLGHGDGVVALGHEVFDIGCAYHVLPLWKFQWFSCQMSGMSEPTNAGERGHRPINADYWATVSAVEKARKFVDGHDNEVWYLARKVAVIKHHS
jgi:hypothetical protein